MERTKELLRKTRENLKPEKEEYAPQPKQVIRIILRRDSEGNRERHRNL